MNFFLLQPAWQTSLNCYRKALQCAGYISITYKEVIDKLVALQPEDGLWRSDLLKPEHETSGYALVCLPWGGELISGC